DGVLIGRASYGYPFVFRPQPADQRAGPLLTGHAPPDHAESRALLQIAIEHAQLYEATFGHRSRYYFLPMRKHLSWYVRGLPSASHLRRELVHVENLTQATAILQHYLTHWRVAPAATAVAAMDGSAGSAGVGRAAMGSAAAGSAAPGYRHREAAGPAAAQETSAPSRAHIQYDAARQNEVTAT
ncbi:MAG: tRNA-dihydrouridine synthase, partial [Caldilineaceae bacterium]